MDQRITTRDRKFTCIECKNENTLHEDLQMGDVMECDFCGIEYDIVEEANDNQYILQILEEEK